MKSSLSFALGLAGIFILAGASSLRAEDWTTTDGKVYQDVSVIKAEPDAVTILDRDGGALIPMTKLSAEIQQRLGYDPVRGQEAADARAQAEAAFIAQAKEMADAALAAQNANAHNPDTGPIMAPACAGTHSSMENLISSNSLDHDSDDPNHTSMDGLIRSGRHLDDSYDGDHTSIDGLVRASRELDGSNDSHHVSMDGLING